MGQNLFGRSNARRVIDIQRLYRAQVSKEKLGKYADFITWLRDNQSNIDFALVWGSYVKSLNTHTSYSRLKESEGSTGLLKCGESDFDGLIIVGESMDRPKSTSMYRTLTKNLEEIACTQLDIYRDVFIVKRTEVSSFFDALEDNHLALYAYSCAHDGIILQDNIGFASYIAQYALKINSERIAASYYKKKYEFLKSFL